MRYFRKITIDWNGPRCVFSLNKNESIRKILWSIMVLLMNFIFFISAVQAWFTCLRHMTHINCLLNQRSLASIASYRQCLISMVCLSLMSIRLLENWNALSVGQQCYFLWLWTRKTRRALLLHKDMLPWQRFPLVMQ